MSGRCCGEASAVWARAIRARKGRPHLPSPRPSPQGWNANKFACTETNFLSCDYFFSSSFAEDSDFIPQLHLPHGRASRFWFGRDDCSICIFRPAPPCSSPLLCSPLFTSIQCLASTGTSNNRCTSYFLLAGKLAHKCLTSVLSYFYYMRECPCLTLYKFYSMQTLNVPSFQVNIQIFVALRSLGSLHEKTRGRPSRGQGTCERWQQGVRFQPQILLLETKPLTCIVTFRRHLFESFCPSELPNRPTRTIPSHRRIPKHTLNKHQHNHSADFPASNGLHGEFIIHQTKSKR